jgi:hypothetical protein
MTKSPILSVGDHVSDALKEAQGLANSFTYPVFINSGNDKPDLIASSVAIQRKGKVYLVTASHVLDEVKNADSPFYIGLEGKFVAIEGEFTRSVGSNHDNFDIAFIELKDTFLCEQKISSVPEEKILCGRKFDNFHLALIHGYPCTKNKQFSALLGSTTFKSLAFSYSGQVEKEFSRASFFKKHNDFHICMKYGAAKDVTGAMVIPPKPQGISGGGFWIMPNSFKPRGLYLGGIAIEYHKTAKFVFATKIQKVIEFIDRYA